MSLLRRRFRSGNIEPAWFYRRAWPVSTPATRYRANEALTTRPLDSVGRIVPTPVSTERWPGSFGLSADAIIYYEEGLAPEAQQLAAGLAPVLGRRPKTTTDAAEANITLRRADVTPPTADSAQAEAYRLTIDSEEGIEIVGTTDAGVFYGVQSLEAWLPVTAYRAPSPPVAVPAGQVVDGPRFGYRGLHLDVARNFQSVDAVKRLLDVMAFYKLDTFHFHLTDDEGWRLAVDGLPTLTEVGGRRGHTFDERDHLVPSYGSGPNPAPFASPGSGWYSRADYLEILRYAKARQIEVMPEIDVLGHARAAIVAMKARSRRLRASGDTAAARSNILSLQGQLWAETLRSTDRMEYMAVPRLLSLAERAWAPRPDWATLADIERLRGRRAEAWNAFANRLGQRELPRLSVRVPNWSYRLPPPGGLIENGHLKVNVGLPGLPVRYTTDGTTPTSASPRYTSPVSVEEGATVKLRTFDTLGRGGGPITVSH